MMRTAFVGCAFILALCIAGLVLAAAGIVRLESLIP